jgi:hypothetical protein
MATPAASPSGSPTATPTDSPAAGPDTASMSAAPLWPAFGVLVSAIAAPRPAVTVKPRPKRPVKGGRVRLALACSGAACNGRLDLAGNRSHRFALDAGARGGVAIRLVRRERRALAGRGRLTLRFQVQLAGAPGTDARRLTVRTRGE